MTVTLNSERSFQVTNSDQTIDRRYLAIKVPNPLVPVDNNLAGRRTSKADEDCAKALFILCCLGCILAFIDVFCCCCKNNNNDESGNYYRGGFGL